MSKSRAGFPFESRKLPVLNRIQVATVRTKDRIAFRDVRSHPATQCLVHVLELPSAFAGSVNYSVRGVQTMNFAPPLFTPLSQYSNELAISILSFRMLVVSIGLVFTCPGHPATKFSVQPLNRSHTQLGCFSGSNSFRLPAPNGARSCTDDRETTIMGGSAMGNTLHFPVGIATLGVALEAHSVWAHEAIPDGFPAKSLLIPCPLMKFADFGRKSKSSGRFRKNSL